MADLEPPASQVDDRKVPESGAGQGTDRAHPPSAQGAPDNRAQAQGAEDEAADPASPVRAVGQAPATPRQAYAAIDLGTNNCRLLIARPSGEHFVVIDAFSRVVRLGEGLAQTGRLSDAAMDRALGALRVCADKLRRRNVHLARSVATEACRRASNGEAFIERVREETGIVLDVISAQEEARLAVLGCHVLLEQGEGPAMIFDIGGGSTELVLIETGDAVPRIMDWQSVPWGVVSLTESFPAAADETDTDRLHRYRRMRAAVSGAFRDFSARLEPFRDAPMATGPRLLGTSGTVTTLASLHLGLPQYDRRAVDGLIVEATAMRDIAKQLSTLSPAERQELPCIGRDRAELVVAGCAILETILDLWPAARLGVADRGIREGILRSLMAGARLSEQNRALARRMKAL
ncbi:Ppx/GppA phosphatase family protein [Croceicoccus sp. BE223]|uniref:Ppx/GppA phosphatase family protein n=1 Tax=Croceicoccus sp. BE223 TaxID=2817716 RepID=UPI00285646FA|nr:Ppx/GppA phosphatase family protein [Croceicoccus sp. BE223]MDR7102239.1 exopolyphosphatase/guanosine-5'-triphosphate,3'-diphosphate pyrophosphatase [Croceicoccus sp. BE223]